MISSPATVKGSGASRAVPKGQQTFLSTRAQLYSLRGPCVAGAVALMHPFSSAVFQSHFLICST